MGKRRRRRRKVKSKGPSPVQGRIKIPSGWKNEEGFGIDSEFVFQRSGVIKTPQEMISIIEEKDNWSQIVAQGLVPTKLVDCGATGCVFETYDPDTYMKATRDFEEFALSQLFMESPSDGFVPIWGCHKLSSDLFLIWKARLESTGLESLGWLEDNAGAAMDDLQHAAQLLNRGVGRGKRRIQGYNSMGITGAKREDYLKVISGIRKTAPWFENIADTLEDMTNNDLSIADTHTGNIGLLFEEEEPRLVLFDGELQYLQTTCRICDSSHHFDDCMKLLKKNTGLSWNKIYQELDAHMIAETGQGLREAYTWEGGETSTKKEIIEHLKMDDISVKLYPVFKSYIWKKAGISEQGGSSRYRRNADEEFRGLIRQFQIDNDPSLLPRIRRLCQHDSLSAYASQPDESGYIEYTLYEQSCTDCGRRMQSKLTSYAGYDLENDCEAPDWWREEVR